MCVPYLQINLKCRAKIDPPDIRCVTSNNETKTKPTPPRPPSTFPLERMLFTTIKIQFFNILTKNPANFKISKLNKFF